MLAWAVLAVSLAALPTVDGYPRMIPLGALLKRSMEEDEAVEAAVNFAIHRHNLKKERLFNLELRHGEIKFSSGDSWQLQRLACDLLKDGFFLLLADGDHSSHAAYSSLSHYLHLPYINWNLSPSVERDGGQKFEVSLRPSATKVLADLILYKDWPSIIYMSDGAESVHNLQQLYHYLSLKAPGRRLHVQLLEVPESKLEFAQFLQEFHQRRYNQSDRSPRRVVMDLSSPERQDFFLQALREQDYKDRRYHYTLLNFDFTKRQVDLFSNGNVNVTGFQLMDTESVAYRIFLKSYRSFLATNYPEDKGLQFADMTPEAGLAHDAVLVALAALESSLKRNSSLFHESFRRDRMQNHHMPGIYCNPSEDTSIPDRPALPFEHGPVIARHLRDVETQGLSGKIQFDAEGRRRGYYVRIVDLTFNDESAYSTTAVHTWKEGLGIVEGATRESVDRSRVDNVGNETIVITVVKVAPFLMPKTDEKGDAKAVDPQTLSQIGGTKMAEMEGGDVFEGYCIDLIKLLAEKVPLESYVVRLVRDKKYGAVKSDGSWNGMIGELLRGEAHMAVAPLTINRARERVVDFSKPFMTTGISIMIKKPDKQEFSVFSFMQPLSSEIWMYIIFAYVGVSVVIFLVSRFSPYEWRVEEMSNGGFTISNDFSVYNCLWFTLAAFMQQGTDILPRSVSGRIASSAWWFFTMIMVSSYTANLAAFLTLEKMKAPIESVEDLAKQTKIKYGVQGGGSTASFFQDSTVQIYQRMWQYMVAQVPSVFTNSYAEGIQRVRESKGRYAFLLEATGNEYANTRKPCDTMKVGQNLNSLGFGVATPFGSNLKNRINLAILELQERGELKKLENKWWYDRGQCDQGISDSQSASLNLSKVAGIFYILIGGMLIAMIAALGEFLYRSRIEARKGKRGLSSSMKAQLNLSVQGEKATKGLIHSTS